MFVDTGEVVVTNC